MIEECFERLDPAERSQHPLQLMQEAQSAYYPGRPVFNTVLQMADRGEVYGVIVVHPNRVSRNHADSGAFVQRLVDGTITSLVTTGGKNYTGADSNDISMLTLEGAMSWKDSRDKGDRILQAMRMRAAEGKHMGPVRIGYESVYRPDGTRVLSVVDSAATPIRRLFELAATGTHSLKDLVGEAERLGLRSRGGLKLHKAAVHTILRDPLYKGYIRFDGKVHRGTHDAIVEEELWERVQRALSGRATATARPKDVHLRESFIFGSLLRCPSCGRTLNAYRAKGKYVYYECKNYATACGVCVPQPVLVEQLKPLLSRFSFPEQELKMLREQLLREHRERTQDEIGYRRDLNEEYERLQQEIADLFSQRKEAAALGVLDAVDRRLGDLRARRDGLQRQMNGVHEKSTAWVDRVIRAFELIKMLQEASIWGSRHSREMFLQAVASNFSVDGKRLVPELRSPFREVVKVGDGLEWWAGLYDVRTEIARTYDLLRLAHSSVVSPQFVLAG